jgi:hypothetical protein
MLLAAAHSSTQQLLRLYSRAHNNKQLGAAKEVQVCFLSDSSSSLEEVLHRLRLTFLRPQLQLALQQLTL